MTQSPSPAVLVVVTTGKEEFVRVNAVLQTTLAMAQQGLQVELLVLGSGVELLRSNQRSSPQFSQWLTKLRAAGVRVAACQVSLEGLGLTDDQRFEAEVVMGGKEVAARIADGHMVLTF